MYPRQSLYFLIFDRTFTWTIPLPVDFRLRFWKIKLAMADFGAMSPQTCFVANLRALWYFLDVETYTNAVE
jgi:hypothetical protein